MLTETGGVQKAVFFGAFFVHFLWVFSPCDFPHFWKDFLDLANFHILHRFSPQTNLSNFTIVGLFFLFQHTPSSQARKFLGGLTRI